MKKIIMILFVVIAIIIVLPLSYNNAQLVEVNYLFGSYQKPLSWFLIGSLILGALLALPFFALTGWGWKLKAKGLQKQVDELVKQRKRDEIADQFKAEKKA